MILQSEKSQQDTLFSETNALLHETLSRLKMSLLVQRSLDLSQNLKRGQQR